jgi:hypothetical protein
MQIFGRPSLPVNAEARDFIDLYGALGERAENFLPDRVFDSLRQFVYLCYEEPFDPQQQMQRINRHLQSLKQAIPGYVDVALLLFPHESSKAYAYRHRRRRFSDRLTRMIDLELLDGPAKKEIERVLASHDFSIGTPPVSGPTIAWLYQILLGGDVLELRKFRDVIGVSGDVAEAHWSYLLDVLDQMIVQSTHYTTETEVAAFLKRMESTVNFKGLNGFIRTVVSGSAKTATRLLAEDVFGPGVVRELAFTDPEAVYAEVSSDTTSVFALRTSSMRRNLLDDYRWFPLLTRLVFIDDSREARLSNVSLVFALHNGIINSLNRVHTKKLGAPANTQMNLRLLLEKVNPKIISEFRQAAARQMEVYAAELRAMRQQQTGNEESSQADTLLFRFDAFARQLLQDRYILSKFTAYLGFVEQLQNADKHEALAGALRDEFETRMKRYFYRGVEDIHITTIHEGGGRNQIRTYGEYLLNRPRPGIDSELQHRCRVILDVIPDSYERTLHNHFHRNFGINLFLERYREYLIKTENQANNEGRFRNLLIDLGILERYAGLSDVDKPIIRQFLADIGNQEITSVADDAQMIIRDLVLNSRSVKPFIFLNQQAAWEYRDLFPIEDFDINAFDIEIELDGNGRIDYPRFLTKLQRLKNTFQLFDESGKLWDVFCQNATIVINDPANPTGLSDFNDSGLLDFLRFIASTQITLFLDEAYNDAVKIEDPAEPKWRTISNYIMNNITAYARISMVASLSTTKNLGATGDRLGALAATSACRKVIDFARQRSAEGLGNVNSLYLLVNILEVAEQAKAIKNILDESLPKDASRFKVKQKLTAFITRQIAENGHSSEPTPAKRESLFPGSPLHLLLLDKLTALDKLDVLGLPDDFKYRGEAFFSYYKRQLVHDLNQFRINRKFRSESKRRLQMALEVAGDILAKRGDKRFRLLDADGSFLFNLVIDDFFSYQDLEAFTQRLAEARGLAVIPYPTGFVRFSLGGYVDGSTAGYGHFASEFATAVKIFLHYWDHFYELKSDSDLQLETSAALDIVFPACSDTEFVARVRDDYAPISQLPANSLSSLRINHIKTLYHPFPEASGVTIHSLETSANAVIEFTDSVGSCPTLEAFVNSLAFSKLYENLLPQISGRIPALRHLDVHEVMARFGKATILNYIRGKRDFEPTHEILDGPDELSIMREILYEMEELLFADSKVKLLALTGNERDPAGDLARLEGYNQILRKYIRELLLHFNLPFDHPGKETDLADLFYACVEIYNEVSGQQVEEIDLVLLWQDWLAAEMRQRDWPKALDTHMLALPEMLSAFLAQREVGPLMPLFRFYLLKHSENGLTALAAEVEQLFAQLEGYSEAETTVFVQQNLAALSERHLLWLTRNAHRHISATETAAVVREIVLFLTHGLNQTLRTERFYRYNHAVIRFTLYRFKQQNSHINEMVQHGYTLQNNFQVSPDLRRQYGEKGVAWLPDWLEKCGVIAAEMPVQVKTRIQTDAKKRGFPFFLAATDDPTPDAAPVEQATVKRMRKLPPVAFFNARLERFVTNLDANDFRCRMYKRGLVNELFIVHKAFLKYFTDYYRLVQPEFISLREARRFVPDIMLLAGVPEKVISFPSVAYFDLPGPEGSIKTVVTPLRRDADYFGNIKKPRLTMLNEKIKEMGGIPIHGSLFIVEEDDGSLFGVLISGDSGVGKSEMLAAMMLQWLNRDLPGIRSIRLVAGDMLHLFPDKEGNLYGVGTEVGDFSRVTDFDPAYVKAYQSLFESSSDSNVDDLNSRSTISGLCDISMAFRIDIMLTAQNAARQEAGVIKYSNVENFILYRDAHGERKEKATSSDNPNFQRTLLRYTGDREIVDVLDRHGNYLDAVLTWDFDALEQHYYLASSYKLIDKIDLDKVVRRIFTGKRFSRAGEQYTITTTRFDIIKNRFIAECTRANAEAVEIYIDRDIFSRIFNSLASTPAGNPFIAEGGEIDMRHHLINVLKGGSDGRGAGRQIQCGILSTDLGKKGKEISGPQKAAAEVKNLIQEVRNSRPESSRARHLVKEAIARHYGHLFRHDKRSLEVERYNYYLWQMQNMRRARLVRLDDAGKNIDTSRLPGMERGRQPAFAPLLVTPNLQTELRHNTESYEQLMTLPNNREFAAEFGRSCTKTYIPPGYDKATQVNNVIIQLLLLNGYIESEDLSRGRISEKVNRETLAAAKAAASDFLAGVAKE